MTTLKVSAPAAYSYWSTKGDVQKIIKASDCIEGRPQTFGRSISQTSLFHCESIQPIHTLSDKDFFYINKILQTYPNLEFLSFHVAFCSPGYTAMDAYKTGPSLSSCEMMDNFLYNIKKIKKITGPTIEILIENNNYFEEKIHAHVTTPAFLHSLIREGEVGFLCDIAHAKITAANRGLNYPNYLHSLPLESCRQLHLSKPLIEAGISQDSHDCPDSKEFEEALSLSTRYPSISNFTIEFYRNADLLSSALGLLKRYLSNV